ncbi:MAG: restriction endonuclease subunit S, partial [Elusimicrobia bacterium]|nr:restriction endonuclease subunit S [Elusimicrobiota bacterium]
MNQTTTLRMEQKFKKTPAGEIPVDWETCELGVVASQFLNGGTPDTRVPTYWQGSIPWITGADFVDQRVGLIRRYINQEAVRNSATNVVPKGSVLVVTRTGVGKVAVAPFDIAISQDITGIIPDDERAESGFLYRVLDFNAGRLQAIHQGTSIN